MAAKVTVHSDVAEAKPLSSTPGIVTVTDAKGRVLVVKKMAPLQRMRLLKAVGSENANNAPYLGYAALAASVSEIDGEAVTFPTTEAQVEFLVQRLGDEGLDAIGQAVRDNFITMPIEESIAIAKK
ncbi:MAG: hypothetical protein P4M09_16890 [Devosia sp.]|nr:hypothetical protein [Devosia sp.]